MGRVSLDSLGGGALLEKVNMDLMQIVKKHHGSQYQIRKAKKVDDYADLSSG